VRIINWLKYGIFSLGLLSTALGIVLFFVPYPMFTTFIIQFLGFQGYSTQITTKIFTEITYGIVQWLLIVIGVLGLIFSGKISLFLYQVSKIIVTDAFFLFNQFIRSYSNLSKQNKLLFFVIIISIATARLVVLCQYELLVDEAFSYVFFVSKGPLVTASYYPGPNNHIFYNLLCCGLYILPISSYWIMKLPAFLASMVLIGVLFLYVRAKFDGWSASISVAILAGNELFITYSLLGRGYSLVALFTFLALVSFLQWTETKQSAYRTLFIGSSILGFYTVPVFLYPFVAIVASAIIYSIKEKDRPFGFDFLKSFIWIIGFVFLLYLPIIIFNGVDSLTENVWVKSVPIQEYITLFPKQLLKFYSTVTGIPTFLSVEVIVVIFILMEGKKLPMVYFLLYLTAPLIFLGQRVFPFDRVWTYFAVVNALLAAQFSKVLVRRFPELGNFILIFFLALSIGSNTYWSAKKIKDVSHFSSDTDIIAGSGQSVIFTNDDTYNVFLRLAFLEAKKPLQLDVYQYDATKNYGSLILKKKASYPDSLHTERYHMVHKNKFVCIFVHK
jgi:hypothetical protein